MANQGREGDAETRGEQPRNHTGTGSTSRNTHNNAFELFLRTKVPSNSQDEQHKLIRRPPEARLKAFRPCTHPDPYQQPLPWVLGSLLYSETKVKVKVMSYPLQPHGLYIHGILQARILEWVAFPFSRGSSQPRDRTQVSHIAGRFFTSWATREAHYYKASHQIPQVGAHHFEDLNPLYLSLPDKAIDLFFSTSPKTLSPSSDSTLVHRGQAFGITMMQAIRCLISC